MIRTYFQMLIEEELPDAVGKMKQFASWFTHGVPGGAGLRKAIYESKSAARDTGARRRILRSPVVRRGSVFAQGSANSSPRILALIFALAKEEARTVGTVRAKSNVNMSPASPQGSTVTATRTPGCLKLNM